jgi:hypothetical protein
MALASRVWPDEGGVYHRRQMSAQPSRILLTRRLFLDFGARNTCACI